MVSDQLQALRERGFRFIDPRDERGEILTLVGIRAHGNVVDVVKLNGEDDVVATRLPSGEDILAPSTVYWRQAGPADRVLAELLALPDDRSAGRIRAGKGCR